MLLLPVILLTSCLEENDADSAKVDLTFRLALKENLEGRITEAQRTHPAFALISVATPSGDLVLDQQEVALQQDADAYVTAPVALPQGRHRLVDLMIVDTSGEVRYATPRKGSEMSQRIARSLPYDFVIDSEKSFDHDIEVVDTHARTAASFGYESFRRGLHALKLQVFLSKDNKLQQTSAEALIMKGLDTIRTYQLSEKMNLISFIGDPGQTYSLVVAKDSYARFSHDFTPETMNLKPIKVVLEPALTVVAVPLAEQNYFGMQLDPAWGIFDFNVDWGDGTTETWTSGVTTAVEHLYPQPGQYFISITGHALDSVVLVGNLAGGGDIQRLGLEHIINLHDFRIEYGQTPKVIDLTHSTFLAEVRIYPRPGEETQLEELYIPDNTFIHTLEIGANTNMKPESLNEVIRDLHHQVVNDPRQGSFWYGVWYDEITPNVQPSAEAVALLRELKNTYHWSVFPDPDLLP